MGKSRVALVVALLASFFSALARADIVPDLNAAQVSVADQGKEALTAAAGEALAEVLVKVSGTPGVLQTPAAKAALGEARSRAQQYSYVRGATPAEGLSVRFEFDQAYVADVVTRSGAPLWTANRPLVLVWVVLRDASGQQFLSWDGTPDPAAQLIAEFARRGVPVQLPLLDLVDTAAVTPEDAWSLDVAAFQAASGRYNVQDIMVGRLSAGADGSVAGDWRYIHLDEYMDRSVTAPDQRMFFREGVSVAAQAISSRYAVAPSAAAEGGVVMSISGVTSYADYAGVVSWLEGLELIDSARVVQTQGDRIVLRLDAKAAAPQLAALLALNTRLVQVAATDPGIPLNYQWQN